MSDEVKYTGPTTLAKNTALVKAELGKKLDKTGGTLTGDLTISGAWLNVKSTDTGDGNISVDGSLVAGRGVSVLNGGKYVSLVCTGDNAAKIAGSGNNCARLAVGTPTGDNDAATKAYVDGLAAAGHEVITVTSTNVSNLGYDAEEGATKYTVFFDTSFDSILANLASNKPMKFNITIPDNDGDISISFNTGYVSALGNSLYLFTGTLAGAPIVLSINALGAATIYMYGDYLPEPNPDDSDDGKVLAVNKHKWEMKKPKEDFVVNITFNTAAPPSIIDDRKIAVFSAATDKSFAEISSAVAAGKNVYGVWDGNKWPLYRSSSTEHSFRGSVQLDRVFGSVGLAIANCIVMQNVCTVEVSAGELPAPALDGSDNGKVPRINGKKWELQNVGGAEDYLVAITTLSPSAVPTSVDGGIATFTASCDKTFAEIKGAIDAGKNVLGNYIGNIWPLTRATDTIIAFEGTISLVYFGDTRNTTCSFVIQSNGNATINCAAGELPAPSSDGSDNGKVPTVNGTRWEMKKDVVDDALSDTSTNPVQNKVVKVALDGKASTEVASQTANGLMSAKDKNKLDGVEDGATRVIVDDSMSGTSTNPVQNKAVKAALDGKLSTLGGEISGHLEVGQTVSAEGSVSVGRTSADTGIHFEKAASDAGRISHGSDPMTGVSPIARLKVATPTEDDDAVTKKYVEDRAVRHDAAQGLTSDQKLIACSNIGAVNEKRAWVEGEVVLLPRGADGAYTINITPSENSNDYTLALDAGPENVPVYVAGIETPTDAQTDCAANVAYVKAKIAEVAASGGVDVDNALSATSTNPVQNKVITSALNGKADKSELGNKADKTALDAKADKTALDAKMDKSGGTFTGNVYGKYFCGTWLQSTAASDLGRAPGKIAVLDDSGWVYYRTPAELLADIGAMSGGDYYTKAETDAAIAVRASTSAYGTTKLSNSTTSSSKTLAATPYAVKTALAQAKAYVDSAIAVAINSAY